MSKPTLIALLAAAVLALIPASPALAQPNCPPSSPTGFSASDGTDCGGVQITWNDVTGADSYLIYRTASNQYMNAVLIGTTVNDYWYDQTTSPGVHWYYWIQAHHTLCLPADQLSSLVGPNQGTRGLAQPPSNVQASDGTQCGGVLVTWNSVAGTTAYNVYRATSNNIGNAQNIALTPATQWTDLTAVVGTTYWYWVDASTTCGLSNPSTSNSGFRAAVPPPTNVQATDGTVCHAVLVSWDLLPGATVYQVYRNTVNNFSTASLLGTALDNDYSDITAFGGVLYYYWVQATTSCGGTQPSAPDLGYTGADLPVPTGLAYVPEAIGLVCGQVGLLWDPPEFGIEVWRSATSDLQPTTYVGFSPSGYTQFTDSTLTLVNHGVYNYYIRFRNACGPGPFCDPVVGYVSSPPPYEQMTGTASTSAVCDRTELGILVTWEPVTAHPPVINYRVYRDFELLGSVPATDPPSYWDTDVQPGAQHTYYVEPVNACGTGSDTGNLVGVAAPHPELSAGPASQSVGIGSSAQFTATVTGQVSALRWQHNGADLNDGPHISGATTTHLTIISVTAADDGTYRITAASDCGPVLSNNTTLTVSSCPADFNADGARTVSDIFAMLSAWFSHSPAADWNHDSLFTVGDIFAFLTSWFAGCP